MWHSNFFCTGPPSRLLVGHEYSIPRAYLKPNAQQVQLPVFYKSENLRLSLLKTFQFSYKMAEFDEATLRQCFDELDADKSGSVELKDIKQVVAKANLSEDAGKKVIEVRIFHLQM